MTYTAGCNLHDKYLVKHKTMIKYTVWHTNGADSEQEPCIKI